MSRLLVAFTFIFAFVSSCGAAADDERMFFSHQNWVSVLKYACPKGDTYKVAIAKVDNYRKKDKSLNMAEIVSVFSLCGYKTKQEVQPLLSKLRDNQICKETTYPVKGANQAECSKVCQSKASEIGCNRNGITYSVPGYCVCNAPKFKEVCRPGNKDRNPNQICVTDFKGRDVGQFQMLQAVGIAKEYARVKKNITDLECSEKYRTDNSSPIDPIGDDFVKCMSPSKKMFFEFRFDDVQESKDATIQMCVKRAIAKIYNTNFSFSYDESVGQYHRPCNVGIGDALKRFGYLSSTSGGLCNIDSRVVQSQTSAYGIDRMAFYKDIQIKLNEGTIKKLKRYVEKKLKKENVKTFDCDYNPRQIANVNGQRDNDDLLKCRVNGQGIQFVFDDMSEMSRDYDKGGQQAMDCIVAGGTYNGRSCSNLTHEQCDDLAKTAGTCKDCKAAKWNDKKKICELPSSSHATSMAKTLAIATTAASAAAVIVAVAATGGTFAIVMVPVATGSAAASIGSSIKIQSKIQPWFEMVNTCDKPDCAMKILRESVTWLAQESSDYTQAESSAMEEELVRLVGLIPKNRFRQEFEKIKREDEEHYKKIKDTKDWDYLKEYERVKGLDLDNPESWSALQIIRAIGNVGLFASGLAVSAKEILPKLKKLDKVVAKNNNWVKFANAFSDKMSKVADATDLVTGIAAANDNAVKVNVGQKVLNTTSEQLLKGAVRRLAN